MLNCCLSDGQRGTVFITQRCHSGLYCSELKMERFELCLICFLFNVLNFKLDEICRYYGKTYRWECTVHCTYLIPFFLLGSRFFAFRDWPLALLELLLSAAGAQLVAARTAASVAYSLSIGRFSLASIWLGCSSGQYSLASIWLVCRMWRWEVSRFSQVALWSLSWIELDAGIQFLFHFRLRFRERRSAWSWGKGSLGRLYRHQLWMRLPAIRNNSHQANFWPVCQGGFPLR